MPWNIVLLLGGSLALAHGSKSTPSIAISILLCLLVAMFPECSGNHPLSANIGLRGNHYQDTSTVTFPCIISASLAFMLPSATLPSLKSWIWCSMYARRGEFYIDYIHIDPYRYIRIDKS